MDGARFEQGRCWYTLGQRIAQFKSLVVIGVNDQGEKKYDRRRGSRVYESWREVSKGAWDERAELRNWRRCAGVLVGSG